MDLGPKKGDGAGVFLSDLIGNIADEESKKLVEKLAKDVYNLGLRVEKSIFKYMADRVIGHIDPPSAIDGIPSFIGVRWKPLTKAYSKRKAPWNRNKKFLNTGHLRTYIAARNAAYYYKKPKIKTDVKNDVLTYESMFRDGRRRKFATHDGKSSYELKLTRHYGLGDNFDRPIIEPMEDFMWKKFLRRLDDLFNKWLEKL